MGDKKNVLIVYAHPEPKSFNGALKDAAVETLRAQGHDVVVSDLYEMGFDPVASKASFKGKPFFLEKFRVWAYAKSACASLQSVQCPQLITCRYDDSPTEISRRLQTFGRQTFSRRDSFKSDQCTKFMSGS